MVKYNVNLKFKDEGKSLNEIITEVLKIEIKKQFVMTCNNLKVELYHAIIPIISKMEGVIIDGRE